MALISGVDGCGGGWLCLSQDIDTDVVTADVYWSARSLIQSTRDHAVVAIDIPIGLPTKDPRECDLVARRLLGPGRGSSVFPAPVRATLAAATWEEACRLSANACGKRLSRQTFAIIDRIREVDDEIRQNPALQSRVREVHPELCFYYWNACRPMRAAKKKPEGERERLELIEHYFGNDAFTAVRPSVPSRLASDDDIIDAFAALWTSRRIVENSAVTIPSTPAYDERGIRMEMLA